MSNRKILFILLLFVLVLISFRIPWMLLSDNKNKVEADQGVVDLRKWDFDKNDMIFLDGEWEFYPDKLLMPSDIEENSKHGKNATISVPSDWSNYFDKAGSGENDGTYRLRMLVADEQLQGLYKIQLPRKTAVSKLFINDQLAIDNHFVKGEEKDRDPNLIDLSASFRAEQTNEIDILIHVSDSQNFRDAGIVKSIQFGKESAINSANYLSIAMQLLVVVIILIHFFYSIVLFILRRKHLEYLYFAFSALCAVIATLMDDDKLLLYWLDISYLGSVKVLFLAYIGIAVFFLLFIQTLFPEYKNHKWIRIIHMLHFLFALLFVFTPIHFLSLVSKGTFIVIAISFVSIARQMWQRVKKGDTDLLFLLLAVASLTMSFLWGFYKSANLVELPYYPIDIVIAFVAFSLYLFRSIFNISDKNKDLTLQLQREMKQKDDFLANTSHELRNPLHGIINIAQSVLQHGRDNLTDYHKENLEVLVNIGRHMSQTLNDLLDITKLKEQKILLHKEELNVRAMALGVMDMLNIMFENKNIQLELHISLSIPNVIADRSRLIQILYNLLHNAIKFTDEGVISIRADIQSDMANIQVEDTGIGMNEETMRRIFKPYEQGDASMTARGQGIGLGLNISRQLVEEHGGTLTVESIQGKGSTFSFTLPLAKDSNEEQAIQSDESIDEKDLSGNIPTSTLVNFPVIPKGDYLTFKPSILVVDDDPVNLKVLLNILSAHEYKIVTVTSGREALDLLVTGDWDLVIADVMMPLMSGYELTRVIRKTFSILELPILLLTARNQPEDIYTGFMAGANDYVAKPTDVLELRARVNTLAKFKKSINNHLHMEAAWLQAQIRPHFLFNTLNTIVSLSETDTERLANLLEQFGHYLRKSFDSQNLDRVVPIEHELDLVRSYLYIEKERFGDRLDIVWEVEDNLRLFVPPLSIQTLVENAVQHGIMKCIQGGKLCLRIHEQADFTEIAIIDDGIGMDKEQVQQVLKGQMDKGKGIGLPNTNKRLIQLYGERLKIMSIPGEGTTVTFNIPKNVFYNSKPNKSM